MAQCTSTITDTKCNTQMQKWGWANTALQEGVCVALSGQAPPCRLETLGACCYCRDVQLHSLAARLLQLACAIACASTANSTACLQGTHSCSVAAARDTIERNDTVPVWQTTNTWRHCSPPPLPLPSHSPAALSLCAPPVHVCGVSTEHSIVYIHGSSTKKHT